MQFTSLEFSLFFCAILGGALALRNNTARKWLLLIASMYFYACWDYRFMTLLIGGTLIDYSLARIQNVPTNRHRKFVLSTSLVMNLGLLALFKYNGFFLNSLSPILSGLGLHTGSLHLILPLGISFYSFLRISYAIDVYRGTIKAEESLLDFSLFTCFFPHVVSGPLTRPATLLSQFKTLPEISRHDLEAGFRLFTFGLFKKVVLADRLGVYVDAIYTNAAAYDASTMWMATLAYTIEIYFDFSGYTDMARGIARCLGYKLAENFDFPYLSCTPSEFWRRWHISLSQWFRDYLFIPLGGSRQGQMRTCINLMVTMLLCGLWHGAGWTFVFWGGWHGGGLVVHRLLSQPKGSHPRSALSHIFAMCGTFLFVHIGWVFFRAQDFAQASIILKRMFLGGGTLSWVHPFIPACILATIFLHIIKIVKGEQFVLAPAGKPMTPFILLSLLLLSIVFASTGFTPFIYAQF